uniref:Glycosyl transferase family 2 n=1 Tax=Rhabditophanes sp. KR3021 TaxID=114890 RepID=A0AC35U606_9BILA
MTCEDIKSRGEYVNKAQSKIESQFPLAFARSVYKDYYIIETMFLLSFAPQNQYCFIIDKKQNEKFIEQMKSLANCFPNVYLITDKFDMNELGYNINLAYYNCFETLQDKPWKYIFTLNNDDIQLKTNREMVEILSLYNGAADILFSADQEYIKGRYDEHKQWTYESLNFFNDDTFHNKHKMHLNQNITFQKGYVEASLPRQAVDYLLKNISITKFLRQVDDHKHFAVDEIVWSTLMSDPILNIPGHIHPNCVNNHSKYANAFMTRKSFWARYSKCNSKNVRHNICLLNMEQLVNMKEWPHLFGNKFKAEFDFGGLFCWAEYLYNKTHHHKYIPINKDFYNRLPVVAYNNLRKTLSIRSSLCQVSLSMMDKYNSFFNTSVLKYNNLN